MSQKWKNLDLETLPGHNVRRIHQLVVALFFDELKEFNLTPVQYSLLQSVCNQPGMDQKSVCASIGYDSSTIGGVIDRLETRGLVTRTTADHDRRVRLINPTSQALDLLRLVVPGMLRSQERFLEPLSQQERKELMRLMNILISSNAELSNTPARD